MSASTRKDIARGLLAAAGQGDVAAVEALIAPDFVLEQMVRGADSDTAPAGARYDRQTYLGFLGAVNAMTRSGMNLVVERIIEEGEELAVFGTSDAVSPTGWRYRNAYCWHLSFAGGQIRMMREYYDTALGNRLLAG
jgi:ketosteroid isomerase-like protein